MSKEELIYEFAKNTGGEEIGINDSVTTSFKGHIAYFLARESLQNIIDAIEDETKPVRAEFDLFHIKASELPKSNELKNILLACKEYFPKKRQSVAFFKNAHEVIDKDKKIAVLRIGDYNTTGMYGDDDDKEGNYYNFLKSSGASAKEGDTGGSFGLGKGAYYAASLFHTIFVSSIYNKDKYVFQGKLRLVTHKRDDMKYDSTGSFGYAEQGPVRDKESIPEIFSRKEQGTDIFIPGFYEDGEWEEQIMRSVLNNFWMAILQGKLTVKVGEKTVDADSLEREMYSYFNEYDKDTKENPNPLQQYLAFTNKKIVFSTEDKPLPTLGKVTFSILLKEKYNKRISFFRETGMEIKKTSYPVPIPFAGTFYCADPKGNRVLRAMENPQHDEWDPHNAREKTEEIYKSAKKADKEMREFIRESLRSVFKADSKEAIAMPGLEKHLFIQAEEYESLGGSGSSNEDQENNHSFEETAVEIGAEDTMREEVEIVHPIKVVKKTAPVVDDGDKKTGTSSSGQDAQGSGSGKEEKEGKLARILVNATYRSFAVRQDDEIKHVVVVHAEPEQVLTLSVSVGTDDAYDVIDIDNAVDVHGNKLEVEDNGIEGVKCDKDGLSNITIKFKEDGRYALKILAYENR